MTRIEFRDALLTSLRVQFATKVFAVIDAHGLNMPIEPFLRDLANNLAQGFAGEPTWSQWDLSDHEIR